MRKIVVVFILALAFLVTFGLFITQAVAETVKFTITNYLVKAEGIPVPDVEGHVVGIYERRGVVVYENGDTAAYHTSGTFDFINTNGPFQGYSSSTWQDGSTTMVKYQATMTKAADQKLPTFSGKGDFIKGTGRFQGIKGEVSFNGKYITPLSKETKGDAVIDVTGTYTLPSQ